MEPGLEHQKGKGEVVKDGHRPGLWLLSQCPGEVRSDEFCTTGYEDLHDSDWGIGSSGKN